ncbi:hypothetical protein UA08_07608 [Talaromyces atroroseus]|uniref:Ribosomal RNA methyltransferase FtsJ domain-containing protein n=1 Tax=Talaromyces atroroseus TaxID=1441469 RepID=A0A225AJD7_TALAT|nr:hypothetical protein UA08_07608 [Talaromyces atroroseus]OKL57258.1 hypothetical protein UA08_07608 [Talaromyces atroroseus]
MEDQIEQSVFSHVEKASKIDDALLAENPLSRFKDKTHTPSGVIVEYILKEVPEFRRLSALREQGWNNPEGDQFFEDQRRAADYANNKTAKKFYKMMKNIAHDMHQVTGVFHIKKPCRDGCSVLDMCMAPGGFLAIALSYNPEAQALAFSLPKINGGYSVLLPKRPNVTLRFLDVTMLAEDMGLSSIPHGHPDGGNFLSSQLDSRQSFDLVICDGQVLRNHDRADYRERREASRLCLTQLTLALDHLNPGGTMIVLLHKVEALSTVQLLHTFDKFASVQLFKHTKYHAKRSSFYMLATNVRADSEEAKTAIERWKAQWKIATFGTDNDYREAMHLDMSSVEVILKEFGPRLIKLGRRIWEIQAGALENAPFMRQTPSL